MVQPCRLGREAEEQVIVLMTEGIGQCFDPLFLRTLGERLLDGERLLHEVADARQIIGMQVIVVRHTPDVLQRQEK
jgi:hypothetical protein